MICDILSTSDKGVHRICEENPGFPSAATVFRWFRKSALGDLPAEILNAYKEAKQMQSDFLAYQSIEIADDSRGDTTVREIRGKEVEVPDLEHIARSRLRVQVRQWIIPHLYPTKYSPRLQKPPEEGIEDEFSELMRELDGKSTGLPKHDPADEDDPKNDQNH